jgi:hypothetical protein
MQPPRLSIAHVAPARAGWHASRMSSGGTCFKCNGSGLQSSKPAAKAVRWAVYGYDRAINEPARLYNVYAKGEQAAIAKARRTMEGASAQFKDQYSLENATAIPESEVANFPA